MAQLTTIVTFVTFVFVIGVLGAALYLEPYKFGIMYERSIDHLSYVIFPWSQSGQKSASTPLWLMVHLASALSHLLLSGYMLLRYNKKLATVWDFSHTVFSVMIAMNINHFGEAPLVKAMVINGIPLLIAMVTFDKYNESWWKSCVYFLVISSPVVLETGMYLMR